MILLAIKMLVGDRLKYFGLIAGMTFAAMMIGQQAAIFTGLKSQTGTFIRDMGFVDLWVMDDQVKFSEDQQPIPDSALQRIRGIDGVAWASPLYKGWLRVRLEDGTRTAAIIIGVDDSTLLGAPANMTSGTADMLRQDKAIFIDERDASTKLALRRSGGQPVRLGDRIAINDNDARIVGTFRGQPSFFWDPIIYTTYNKAISFAPHERHSMSFVLLKVRDGVAVREVQGRIAEQTPYIARTGAEFEQVTSAYILKSTGILVNFGIAVGLGLIVGLLVTGQTFFNFTLDNSRYFAALKAMGCSGARIVGMVFSQVITVSILSFGIGIGIAAISGAFLRKTDLAFLLEWRIVAFTAGAMVLVGLTAGALSLIKVLRLEPGVVFKG